MPNYHDHESNQSQRREGRPGKSSGWRSARADSNDGYKRREDRRDDYKRGFSSEHSEGGKRYWDSERSRGGGRDYGRDRDRPRDGYKREDRRGGYQRRNDRNDEERGRSWHTSERGYSSRGERSEVYGRGERGNSRGGYGRERGEGYKRREDRRDWNRDDRHSAGRGFGRNFDERNERSRRDAGFDDGYRNVRGGEEKRARAKELQREIPESITPDMLPEQTYNHLRGLNKDNAQMVARHLAYAAEMMDIDPEVSYQHSKAAYARAARIDIVREALGIAAYVTGRYAEALTELRAYRRFSNDYSHVAMEADSERGLGRSEKALRFIADIPLDRLDPSAKVELAIVTSGAKADMGDSEGGLRLIEKIIVKNLNSELAARVELVKADRLEELGRVEEAQAIRATWEPVYSGEDKDSDILLDLADVYGDAVYDDVEEKDAEEEGAAEDKSGEADEIAAAEQDDSLSSANSASSAESPDEYDEGPADEVPADFSADECAAENLDPHISLEDELKEELGDDFLAEEWAEEFSDVSNAEHDDAVRAEKA